MARHRGRVRHTRVRPAECAGERKNHNRPLPLCGCLGRVPSSPAATGNNGNCSRRGAEIWPADELVSAHGERRDGRHERPRSRGANEDRLARAHTREAAIMQIGPHLVRNHFAHSPPADVRLGPDLAAGPAGRPADRANASNRLLVCICKLASLSLSLRLSAPAGVGRGNFLQHSARTSGQCAKWIADGPASRGPLPPGMRMRIRMRMLTGMRMGRPMSLRNMPSWAECK